MMPTMTPGSASRASGVPSPGQLVSVRQRRYVA